MRHLLFQILLSAALLAGFRANAAETVKPPDLSGTWHGLVSGGFGMCQQYIRVQRGGAGYVGQGMVWFALSEEQAQALVRGQKPVGAPTQAMCAMQQFAIKVDGENVTFQGVNVQSVLNGAKYRPDTFSGKLIPPGIVAGDAVNNGKTVGIFRLAKEDVFAKPLPLDLEKGKTHALSCIDGGAYHYTCYIPGGYDPTKPTPVLVNSNPGGNGKPLSTKLAEEFGWIMIGLTESKNGPWGPVFENRDAALFDLRRRFNIDMKHVYFSGLSGGARASSEAGVAYNGNCAGLILIGATYGDKTPPKDEAIFYITGETDMNRNEVTAAHEAAKKSGRKCNFILHPGGHTWGRVEDQEAAIRWLQQETCAKADRK